MNKQSKKPVETFISQNRKASHDYFIEERFEAGIMLEGWEVKSIRAGKIQLKESYVIIKRGEVWLLGSHISPLLSASTHINPNPTRSRKLLLHEREIRKLIGNVERKGYTLIALDMHWSRGKAKVTLGLAKGKKQYDKRAAIKERDWKRHQERLRKH